MQSRLFLSRRPLAAGALLVLVVAVAVSAQVRLTGPQGPPPTCLPTNIVDTAIGTGETVKQRDAALIRVWTWTLNPASLNAQGELLGTEARVYEFANLVALGRWADVDPAKHIMDTAVPPRGAKAMRVGGRRSAAFTCDKVVFEIELIAAAKTAREPQFARTRLPPPPPDLSAALAAREQAMAVAIKRREELEAARKATAIAEARKQNKLRLRDALVAVPVRPLRVPGSQGLTDSAAGQTATPIAAVQTVGEFTVSVQALMRSVLSGTGLRPVPTMALESKEILVLACPTPQLDQATSVQYDVVANVVVAAKCFLDTPDDSHTTAIFSVICEDGRLPVLDKDSLIKPYLDGPLVSVFACDAAYPATPDYRAAVVEQTLPARLELVAARKKAQADEAAFNTLAFLGFLKLIVTASSAEPTAASCSTRCQHECYGTGFFSTPPTGPAGAAACMAVCQGGCPAP